MSYSSKDSARSFTGRRQPAAGVGTRDGDAAYVEDSRSIGEAVKKIQQHAADIRRETSLLAAAHTYSGSKSKVKEAVQAAKDTMKEAKCLLEGFPTSGGGSFTEQNHRRLTQQKLTENLVSAFKALEAAYRAHDAEVERRRQEEAAAAAAAIATAGGSAGGTGSSGVEMRAVETADEGCLTAQQLQDLDVSEAEAEVHGAIVEEYVQEIATISSDMISLQRAMVDLAEQTREQGVMVDSIEANMRHATQSTEGATVQLTQANQHQRTGSKLIFWLLFLAVLIAVALVIVIVRKHSKS